MAKIIIFGIKDLAELAYYYLTNDSEHEVAAFSVHTNYLPDKPIFCGLPVLAFESIHKQLPPAEYSFFSPLTHKDMNKDRERIYNEIKNKGYNLISYISSKATIFDKTKVGDNCFILEDNTIQPFVTIGSNTILWSGNHIGHHSHIGDHVFITSHVVISGHCLIEPYCFIGVNATIKENIRLGEGTFVSMAGIINKNTNPYSVHRTRASEIMALSSKDMFK
jgi:sugar O-acyltransferase (sialic acid O-acetyltransferase NeuD family)